MDFVLPQTSPSLIKEKSLEEPIEGLMYKMNDKKRKEFRQKISKTLQLIPDVKERLRTELYLISLESKTRSYPNFKNEIGCYINSSRNTINNMI